MIAPSLNLYDKICQDLKKAISHLEYSYQKAGLILAKEGFNEEDLEALEGFASRFARASDMVIQKYLRLRVLQKDPGFRGGVIDVINEAEKFGWISVARDWLRIRELRNVTAHEYLEDELREVYKEVYELAPKIIEIKKLI